MLSSGQLLAERYKLTSRIAVGGMGEVWQASDTRLDRTVAVKVLKAELSDDPEFLHRFRTEARMTASLNHPGIAAVHDYGETVAGEHAIAFLVMELVEGDPLAGILAREGRISAERTLDILEQAGNGLQAAHEQGLVHRDVKPGNILVTPTGQVKITDFGIAKAADAAPVTRNGMVMGTAHYIAPEQALGSPAEPASDVYSLAVCGYECLTGHRPFLSENAVTVAMMHIRDMPPPLPPHVPPAARAVIEATLIKDPRQRYNSGGEFAAAVAAVRAGHPLPMPLEVAARGGYTAMHNPMVPAGPVSHPAMHPALPTGGIMPMPSPQRRNHTGLWVLLAVILVALVVGGALVIAKLVSTGNGEQPSERQSTTSPTAASPGPQSARPAAPTSGPPDHTTQGQPENYGSQGMMNTPWTEWNGTQR
ncbi:MAG: eukaryotic-like serine/threonine-protein kinase [Actinomycetota bacterium]|jgi:serine/threonine-protein kinase|nr:eukaryotic-like serine/threonine-protein kinase [Actinomycetota bacterium]